MEILGRTDCCRCRSEHLDVYLGDTTNVDQATLVRRNFGALSEQWLTFDANSAKRSGRFLFIARDFARRHCSPDRRDKPGTGILNICEVTVYECG